MKIEAILAVKGTDVATIAPDACVRDLISALAERRIGALVVSADGKTVEGIVSERDVVRELAARGATVLGERVSQIMTSIVQCAPPTAKVGDLMSVMTERRFRHIPVLDEADKMIGLVSIGDIVKSHVEELAGERDALIQYVTEGR